ncbi:MAG: PSD1 and planctomycete cytochrome C domain-containing protein [Gemmatales bacterium]|nr:PSD1 and planctomycete cytochrome C domain-containing protein [Gemmatales bacterium]MDW8386392.1 PSD1 and planctomycete cytochrome C domain-containing protein [Gemmatales bacterium]
MRLACLGIFLALLTDAAAVEPVDYRREIKPVLQERCYACHGALAQKAKLRVDSGANMLKAGVIVPGKPDDSPLLLRVSSDDESVRMPPEGHPLKPEQIAKLRRWIEEGAKVPEDDAEEPDPRDHWAFRPVVRPAVPDVQTGWPIRNPIDRFVAWEWEKRGLKPVSFADKRVLLRRVYLDLIGLPPTPEQIAAFVNDTRPDAYERVVDELLTSPHYGERWGRHFLDIWRYSDWWGLGDELRNSQRHIWHWRDWVVESFNEDLGYDEMIRQMLAADELYPTEPHKLRATGYLARPYFLFNRTTWLDEVIEHTGKGILGLTLNCGKCHDHKYDPFTQTDYYSYRAIFEPYQIRTDLVPGEPDVMRNGLPRVFDANLDAKTYFHIRGDERNPDKNRDIVPGLPRFLAPEGLAIMPVKLPPEAYQPIRRSDIAATYRKMLADRLREAHHRLLSTELAVAPLGFPFTLAATSAYQAVLKVEADQARLEAAIADPSKAPGEFRGTVKTKESNLDSDPQAKPLPDVSTGRRAALARWMTDPKNPLTARVAVNHVWMRHFGRPLVPTIFEFGRRGQPPTHPELLDWLAAEFMAPSIGTDHVSGSARPWSFKHLHRLIVTSNAYRLSSSQAGAENNVRLDPENRWLWRMNSVRMEAEVVRDSLLHLAGELDRTLGGPPVPISQQDASRRRSLYLFHSHNDHNKFLDTFDAPNVLECYRRTESIVPQQALALWNSRFAMTMAGKILDRLHERYPDADDARFVTAAFEMILAVPPRSEELTACLETLEELRKVLESVPEAERTRRARLQIVQALINHNDFITVR